MAIQKGNLIEFCAALLQKQLNLYTRTLLKDLVFMQKALESIRIACQQQSPVAVLVVLLFTQFTMFTM